MLNCKKLNLLYATCGIFMLFVDTAIAVAIFNLTEVVLFGCYCRPILFCYCIVLYWYWLVLPADNGTTVHVIADL